MSDTNATNASAATYHVDLVGVQFADGGTASGSFNWDSILGDIYDINLTTVSAANPELSWTFNDSLCEQCGGDSNTISIHNYDPSTLFHYIVNFDLISPHLTSGSSPVTVGSGYIEFIDPPPHLTDISTQLVAGQLGVTMVPLPPTAILLATGLLGLIGVAKRKVRT